MKLTKTHEILQFKRLTLILIQKKEKNAANSFLKKKLS